MVGGGGEGAAGPYRVLWGNLLPHGIRLFCASVQTSTHPDLTEPVHLSTHLTEKPPCKLDPGAQKTSWERALLHFCLLLCWPNSQVALSQLGANGAQQHPASPLPLDKTRVTAAPRSACFCRSPGADALWPGFDHIPVADPITSQGLDELL